jgi:hypothetical protein
MTHSSPEAEYIPIQVSRHELSNVFHELAGLAGAAISNHAVQCTIAFETTSDRQTRKIWDYGSFVLQAVDGATHGVEFAVNRDGIGIYAETTQGTADWAGRKPPEELAPPRMRKDLSAQAILNRTREVIAAAPALEGRPASPAPAHPSGFMHARMTGADFVPTLGGLLALSESGVRYHHLDATADSAQGILGEPYGRDHLLSATAENSDGVRAEFKLEYLPTRPDSTNGQIVGINCHTIVRLGEADPAVLYAYDGLQTVEGRLYRIRKTIPTNNSRLQNELSREPIRPTDIQDLAHSLVDTSTYLQERWPAFAAP